MQAPTSSLTQPSSFQGFTSPTVIYRGFTTTDNDGRELWVGESKDINNIQHYSLNHGKLTFKLKEGIVFVRGQDGKWLKEESKDVIYTTDAVLNQLGIAVFQKLNQEGSVETIGLLNGQRGTKPPLIYATNPTYSWYRSHYDDQSTREINFRRIDAFAFSRTSFKQAEDGSEFSIELEEKYKNDPAVEYAVHRIFGETLHLTQKLDEAVPKAAEEASLFISETISEDDPSYSQVQQEFSEFLSEAFSTLSVDDPSAIQLRQQFSQFFG